MDRAGERGEEEIWHQVHTESESKHAEFTSMDSEQLTQTGTAYFVRQFEMSSKHALVQQTQMGDLGLMMI